MRRTETETIGSNQDGETLRCSSRELGSCCRSIHARGRNLRLANRSLRHDAKGLFMKPFVARSALYLRRVALWA